VQFIEAAKTVPRVVLLALLLPNLNHAWLHCRTAAVASAFSGTGMLVVMGLDRVVFKPCFLCFHWWRTVVPDVVLGVASAVWLSRSVFSSFHTCTRLLLLRPQLSFSAAPDLLPVPAAVGGISIANYSGNSPALGTIAAVNLAAASTSRTFELCIPGRALFLAAASGGWCDASSLGVCQSNITDKVGLDS
jgi:hypothetical protein